MTHDHNITWTIDSDDHGNGITGVITCTAEVGAACRQTCGDGCEEWGPDHEHELVDNGECVLLEWITAYPDKLVVFYNGEREPLRDGPVALTYQGEYVTWEYVDTTEATELVR